jgi:hypothetical protein
MSKITRERKRKKLEKLKELGLIPKFPCESCLKEFYKEELIIGPDPYASEIKGDNTEVVQCKECNKESCWSI